jgi:mono/diheme cytochrome c family protein
VRLLTLELAVSHELVSTVTFQPRFSTALAPLPAAGKRLARDISQVGTTPLPPASVSGSSGAALWRQAGCGSCHTFAATRSTGSQGPDLDLLHPSAAVVAAQVRSGGGGMPAYRSKLSSADIGALASFVAVNERKIPTTAETLNAFGAAFTRFGVAVRGVLADLENLSAPPELHPALVAERHTLEKSAALCDTIAAALAKQDVNGANAAIRRLFVATAGVSSTATQRAQAAAVAAYNARLRRITALAARVSHDRQHLVQTIG